MRARQEVFTRAHCLFFLSPRIKTMKTDKSANVTSITPVTIATFSHCDDCKQQKKLKKWNKFREGVLCDGCYRRRDKDVKHVGKQSTFFSVNRSAVFKHVETQTCCSVEGFLERETDIGIHASTLASIAKSPDQIKVDNGIVKVEATDGMEIVHGPVFFGNDGNAMDITLRAIRTKDLERHTASARDFQERQDKYISQLRIDHRAIKAQLAAAKQEIEMMREIASDEQLFTPVSQEF
jgi:hypothetical protein